MEKLDIRTRSIPEWAAIATLADLSDEVANQIAPGNILEVELKINGVECSFVHIINRMKQEALKWSYECAERLIMDRAESLRDTVNKLSSLADDVEQEVRCKVHQLFPEIPVRDD